MKNGLSFEQFMVMLRADSRDSLDQYDDRLGGSSHSGSCHGAPGGASLRAGGSGHGTGASLRAGGSGHGGLAALLDRSVRHGEVLAPKALDPVAEAT